METLQHGDYCEVTEEQAVELLTIERYLCPAHYAGYKNDFNECNFAWLSDSSGIILSGIEHGDMTNKLEFTDFKHRLVNTMQTA